MKIKECSTCANHVVESELIADPNVAGVAQPVRHWRDDGEVWPLRSTRNCSWGEIGRLIEELEKEGRITEAEKLMEELKRLTDESRENLSELENI